jgi:hypothetical protein
MDPTSDASGVRLRFVFVGTVERDAEEVAADRTRRRFRVAAVPPR